MNPNERLFHSSRSGKISANICCVESSIQSAIILSYPVQSELITCHTHHIPNPPQLQLWALLMRQEHRLQVESFPRTDSWSPGEVRCISDETQAFLSLESRKTRSF